MAGLWEGRVRVPQFIAVTWLSLVCASPRPLAEKYLALVVGNHDDANLPPHEELQEAVTNARAVDGALALLGFEVMSDDKVGRQGRVDRLDAFWRRLSKGDTAFFFFSGHGVSLGGATCEA
jgi:uncharacterized caspase-like protein